MSKKTALDLMAEELVECKGMGCCWFTPRQTEKGTDYKVYSCPAIQDMEYENLDEFKQCIKTCEGHTLKKNDKEICINKIKQYFQQQADIPDGWDELKKLYEKLHKEYCDKVHVHDAMTIKNLYDTTELQAARAGENAGMFYVLHKMGEILQQAGIEEDDVN